MEGWSSNFVQNLNCDSWTCMLKITGLKSETKTANIQEKHARFQRHKLSLKLAARPNVYSKLNQKQKLKSQLSVETESKIHMSQAHICLMP